MADYVIGISGASGSIYGVRLIRELAARNHGVDVVATNAGIKVMEEELGVSGQDGMENALAPPAKGRFAIWRNDDYSAPFMSGSNAFDAVVIIPCSAGKLAAIAGGISGNLLERTADVALKEKRQLILVVRETPLNLIHLENMVKVAKAGAQVLPASPAFYHHPKTVDDMVNFIVGKVLNLLRIEHDLLGGWGLK